MILATSNGCLILTVRYLHLLRNEEPGPLLDDGLGAELFHTERTLLQQRILYIGQRLQNYRDTKAFVSFPLNRTANQFTLTQERCLTLIWFGYLARLSQCRGGGYFTRPNDYYLPSLRLEGGDGQHPVR
jgi:hypothetical protein